MTKDTNKLMDEIRSKIYGSSLSKTLDDYVSVKIDLREQDDASHALYHNCLEYLEKQLGKGDYFDNGGSFLKYEDIKWHYELTGSYPYYVMIVWFKDEKVATMFKMKFL